jgi:hypothetical protein
VRPGPARFEILLTLLFVLASLAAISAGGPSDASAALRIPAAYFVFALFVVRPVLLLALAAPLMLAIPLGGPASDEFHTANSQWILWAASSVLWIPASTAGYWIRWRLDRPINGERGERRHHNSL